MSMDFKRLGAALGAAPVVPDVALTDEYALVVDHMTISDGNFPVVRDPQGSVPGPIAEGIYELKMGQLRLSRKGVARSQYNPQNDKKFPALLRSVELSGLTNPLQVIPTNETKELPGGERVYIYEVVLGVRGWWALKKLEKPTAPCRIRKPDQVGQLLMDAMAEDNNHLKYSLYEHCEAARFLVDVLGFPQTLVAKRFTCSQPKISAMLKAVRHQDEHILQMMADDSLNLEQVCILVDAFPDDLEMRVLCARYAIQQGLSNPQMQGVIQEINPPADMGPARATLVLTDPENEDGAVMRQSLITDTHDTAGKVAVHKPPVKFVLQRRSPLSNSSANIYRMARQAEFRLDIQPDGPVTLADPDHTHVFDLFTRWQTGSLAYITFQMFEEAYLADYQRAVQLVEEAGITSLPMESEVVRKPIVEGDKGRTTRAG